MSVGLFFCFLFTNRIVFTDFPLRLFIVDSIKSFLNMAGGNAPFRALLIAGVGAIFLFVLVTMYTHSQLDGQHGEGVGILGHYFSNRFIRNRFRRGEGDYSDAREEERNEKNDLRRRHKFFIGPSIPDQALGRLPSCPDVDLLRYWREPTLTDKAFVSSYFTPEEERYVTFEPDHGGWNNVRMQMEVVLVFAMTTGRTLVLPPDLHLYLLLEGDKHQKAHSFADFFDFDFIGQRVRIISMEDFLAKEGVTGHLMRYDNGTRTRISEVPPGNRTSFDNTRREEKLLIWGYLRSVGLNPPFKSGTKEYLTIPRRVHDSSVAAKTESRRRVFSAGRREVLYKGDMEQAKLIHFLTRPETNDRLLLHYYTFLFFEDEKIERMAHRFVRDYVHYIDLIFCKAAIIVSALFKEGLGRGYSAFHVRRGDFQYKEVKVSAEVLLKNVGQFIPQNELLYIATDEKNKSFFDPLRIKFPKVCTQFIIIKVTYSI